LAHQQIRAFLSGQPVRGEEEVLFAVSAADAAYRATVQAERFSRSHWTAVYLSERKDSRWDGIVLERRGPKAVVMIPALALETQVSGAGSLQPNDPVSIRLMGVKIPELEINFAIK
jgi:exoribonuclease-2